MNTVKNIFNFSHPIELSEYQKSSRPNIQAEHSVCFQINVHGYLLLVKYHYNYFNSSTYKICHFEFHGQTASETGYQSHWALDEKIDNVIDYAIEAAKHFYTEVQTKFPEKINGQYNLF